MDSRSTLDGVARTGPLIPSLRLGYDNTEIHEAYKKAVDSKEYESVQHISGKSKRAYALNNDQEYFTECTEAIFGTNDFYPFVRSELEQHDEQMYELLRKQWKIKE